MNSLRRSCLSLLAILLALAPLCLPAAEPSITAALQPFVDSHSLARAVTLVSSKDKVLTVDVVGFADIAAKKPMTPDSLFWIASMSKPITGTAVMILVDEGKVSIDDPVEKYLPEFAGQMVNIAQSGDLVILKKPARPITIKDVLSHTSGLPHLSRAEKQIDMLTLKEAGISYALTPLMFEPGSKYQYSNAGINTAGRVIEVVSGMSSTHNRFRIPGYSAPGRWRMTRKAWTSFSCVPAGTVLKGGMTALLAHFPGPTPG
jgi:CubicO group peptidase (beta-lactamase class C family)